MVNETVRLTTQANSDTRIRSLDILRGIVIVLMALDHTRDFFAPTLFPPEDLIHTSIGLFLTRWTTHFCAPVFVFLAGTAVYFFQQKVRDRVLVSRYLAGRGLWLIVVELLIINAAWPLQLPGSLGFFFLSIIWAIGASMIILAGLLWLPRGAILGLSLFLIFGHNAFTAVQSADLGTFGWLWTIMHEGGSLYPFGSNGPELFVTYTLIPWVGVMGAGYVFGHCVQLEPQRRDRVLLALGVGCLGLFILLRGLNLYGDPSPWHIQERGVLFTILSFLNVTKYPASLLFLCLTLGPAIVSLRMIEQWRGRLAEVFRTFGRVPFFFYVLHIPLINVISQFWHLLRYGELLNFWLIGPDQIPPDYAPDLLTVYIAWLTVSTLMFVLCRWFGRYKHTRRHWWLKYL